MKRRTLSLFLTISMLIALICAPTVVSAKQDFCITNDFSDYVGTWDGVNVTTTGCTVPSINGGSTQGQSNFDTCAGVTSGVAPDNKYGTSVKVYTEYCADHKYSQGMRYNLNKNNYLYHSIYMESSVFVESNANEYGAPRTVSLLGNNENGSGVTLAAVAMKDQVISAFGTTTGLKYEFDVWYDYKIWANIDSGEFKVQTWKNGAMLNETSGVNSTLATLREIKGFVYYHDARVNHPTYMENRGPQTTYFDNLKLESIYKFHIGGMDTTKHAFLDFENIDLSSKATINKYNSMGTLLYGNSGGADGTTLESVDTERGKALRIKPWVLDPEEYEWHYANTTMPDGTTRKLGDVYDKEGNYCWSRSTMLYPQIYFDFSTANRMYDGAYFKTDFKFEDENFGNYNMQVTNYYTVLSVNPNGSINVFGVDSGLDFAVDKWYDIEGIIDCDTGYYTVKLTQEGVATPYESTGFVTPVDYVSGGGYTGIYRLRHNLTNRAKANDWSMPTSMLVGDMQLGPVPDLKGAVAGTYTFAKADEAEKFTATGGTQVIANETLKLTAGADAEAVTTMAIPFLKTNFNYSADVTIDSTAADRKLIAQNQTDFKNPTRITNPVEIAKFDADGKLYIGGTEVADVKISEGTYNVNVNFNQANYSANVAVTKADTPVASADVVLGEKATKIINLDWTTAASSSVVLDNVKYSTLYNFELLEDESTHGEGYYITAADDVYAKFTNAVDKSSFTTDSVKVNGGKVAVSEISFVDDYTVKVDFEKVQGTYYIVEFTNVDDLYGNTLTDYIEIDTVRQDLEMSAVSFTKGGKALSIIEPGEISATFNAKANNGNSYDMFYTLGLYHAGRLVDSDFDTFTVGETREPHTLKVTVPDDGKLYILKAFIWDADTCAPYGTDAVLEALSEDTKVALIKFDDLGTGDIENYVNITNWAVENDIKMNYIFMVDYFDPERSDRVLCNDNHLKLLKSFYDNPYIELTNHSYTGPETGSDNSFYGVSSLEKQLTDFELVENCMSKQGITLTSMAPPNNQVNADTVKALNANPEYKAIMVRASNDADLNKKGFFNEDNTFVTLWKYMDVEPSSGYNDIEALKANWNGAMAKGYEYVLLQAHPRTQSLDSPAMKNLFEFFLWLKSQGVVFMHATEYAEYLMTK